MTAATAAWTIAALMLACVILAAIAGWAALSRQEETEHNPNQMDGDRL